MSSIFAEFPKAEKNLLRLVELLELDRSKLYSRKIGDIYSDDGRFITTVYSTVVTAAPRRLLTRWTVEMVPGIIRLGEGEPDDENYYIEDE